MGVSTDAILFFGYCWNEEKYELLEGEEDWEEVVLKRRGIESPWKDHPGDDPSLSYAENRQRGEEWSTANRERLDAWYAAKKEVGAEFGCDIGRHCSGEYPMPYVYLQASQIRASRGYPKLIRPDAVFLPADIAAVDRFMNELGIERPEDQLEPQWWLVSLWS